MLELTDYLFELIVCAVLLILGMMTALQRLETLRLRALIRRECAARETLANDLSAILECSRNIGARVRSQDVAQHRLAKKIEGIGLTSEAAVAPIYERVHKLVAQGLSIEEIADICDLGRGEVELLSHIAERRAAA
jgi:hypothetical protein